MLDNNLVVLLGNPNVGKSSIFNRLTGENQHTGNWTGKTVCSVQGNLKSNKDIKIVDLPGIYTLHSANAEELCSKNYLLEHKDALIIIVIDANNIYKSLTLVEETANISNNVIICINQFNSAKKSGTIIDIRKMEELINLPIITTEATDRNSSDILNNIININLNNYNPPLIKHRKIDKNKLIKEVVKDNSNNKQEKLDRIFTSKLTGIPIMFLLLALVLYITIIAANYPSELLSHIFAIGEEWLSNFFNKIGTNNIITSFICDGIYKTVTWVVSVMLPPMAIFFPIFSLLENFGYLPRVAFNLDKVFCKAHCSGKQALTMCMGFGCNACGVTGCRIINDKNQRLNAIVTNNFVPCNGRFPTLISIITIFMTSYFSSKLKSLISALILTGFIILSIMISMLLSFILSKTILKSDNNNFVMEMPKYKKPKIIATVYEAIKNRAVFVLLRALVVALPAGAIIWICANVLINEEPILQYIVNILDPFGKIFGLDGEIIIALLLGFPANEIVMPIILMAYSGSSTLVEISNYDFLSNLLISNGWTIKTAVCMIIIVLMHFPCSTTCITIYKETKSKLWTILSILLPTIIGLFICFIINMIL